MNLVERQRGMSALSVLTVLLLVSFFMTCAFKLVPIYMDAWTIDKAISSGVESGAFNDKSPAEIRRALNSKFNMNRIEVKKVGDISIKRVKGGKIQIDARYEKRVPLIQNIDVVVKFDDFLYEVASQGQ